MGEVQSIEGGCEFLRLIKRIKFPLLEAETLEVLRKEYDTALGEDVIHASQKLCMVLLHIPVFSLVGIGECRRIDDDKIPDFLIPCTFLHKFPDILCHTAVFALVQKAVGTEIAPSPLRIDIRQIDARDAFRRRCRGIDGE